ncbi:MAG: pyridoxal 5'-phosphate synthase glutaminase subunit PdxT [Thiotrichales bacterium]|nr:MAG: pyridoxal 5'-phosphate synthase glutaminase subunit PdxT [Thiotrichales bacterium]
MNRTVGVLALQGAYQKHVDCLSRLGVDTLLIRKASELDQCDGLIIPGGESTTMSLLIQESGMYEPLRDFAQVKPVMGVCAGMIMMSASVDDQRVKPLQIMPFRALRNHYGRQVHSFSADITLDFDADGDTFHAHFIRAPGVETLANGIEVLATCNDESVMIGDGGHIALSFHPELTDDARIHAYWLSNINV